MRRILFTCGFLACAWTSTLRAQSANGANVQRPPASTGVSAAQNPAVGGVSLGGPGGVLNEEQRASYQAALRAAHGEVMELDAKLRLARQEVLNTSLTGKFDENAVREKAFAAARIEAELAVIRARAFSQVQPPLSAEQIEKIKNNQPGQARTVERLQRLEAPAGTNQDQNGLPPKH
ncbi:MAG TPA: periplasmic heavy metal sensor [Verrucomicrobiae bacterium]|jgi:uncharacterized membrane protein|nr:periplasmic heavy metal sensor [Verrucomicrobiae bacterium]